MGGVEKFRQLRRVAGVRSVIAGTAAAFTGGALVLALQAVFALVSVRYPPIIQGLHCNFARPSDPDGTDIGESAAEDQRLLPTLTTGDQVACHLDAPGADYAAWAVAGRDLRFRSGPLDSDLPCQDGEAFAAQSPDHLRVSLCQRFRLDDPGIYTLLIKVMARGSDSVDRAQLQFQVRQAPLPLPPVPEPPVATRLKAALLLPARTQTVDRVVPVSESLSEHGLLPTSRSYSRVVYRLSGNEEYLGSSFQANSASNASGTRVAHQRSSNGVTMAFTLRSGPFIDRWRGWLSGNVIIKLRRQEPAQTLDLADADLRLEGQTSLPLPANLSQEQLTGSKLRLTRSETSTVVEVEPGSSVTLDNLDITPRVDGSSIVITARPHSK